MTNPNPSALASLLSETGLPVQEVPPSSPTRVLLIGCGQSKLDHDPADPPRAEELYTGSLFRSRKLWADATGRPWSILSAMHGVLGRDVATRAYECRITDLPEIDQAAWALYAAGQILDELPDETRLEDLEVEIHAGKDYADRLELVLSALGAKVSRPLRGLGMLAQRSWYRRHREELHAAALEDGTGLEAAVAAAEEDLALEDPTRWA